MAGRVIVISSVLLLGGVLSLSLGKDGRALVCGELKVLWLVVPPTVCESRYFSVAGNDASLVKRSLEKMFVVSGSF